MKMFPLMLILFLTALLPRHLRAQVVPDLAGTYTWTFSEREGRPSKCDCDYYLERITLHADSTCLFQSQRGRLSPSFQQWERGTWELVSDDRVVLHITEVRGERITRLDAPKVDPNQWRAESRVHSFKLVGRHLEDGGRIYD